MAKNWKHAIVGVGVVGEWHVRVVSKALENSELVALCDRDPKQAEAAMQKSELNLPVYTTMAEMFAAHPEIEVVHICTPSGDHMNPAIEAMKAGKHVICEKPMEIHADRIDTMIAAAKEHGVKLAGIFQNRWREEMRAIKKAVDEGRFGTLAFCGTYTPWFRGDQYYREGGWRGTWALDGGGAIMNQSVHSVDLAQWLAGPIKVVSAHGSSRIHREIEVEDTLSAAVTYENGAHGVLMGTTAMFPGAGVRVEIGGENGMAQTGGGTKMFKFRETRDDDATALEPPAEALNSTGGGSDPRDVPHYLHARNIAHILERWEAGQEAETHGPEARKAVAIIEALYASMKAGGTPVEVG
ncbi:MAG: Gfo/Idh/MocA family protein [Phycisphaerae bacterium]